VTEDDLFVKRYGFADETKSKNLFRKSKKHEKKFYLQAMMNFSFVVNLHSEMQRK
jgi:hypothetical protein